MSQYFEIHPTHPQPRLIARAVSIVRDAKILVYPTDSSYALGCQVGNKTGMERIQRIRRLDSTHDFTLVCRDLSELGTYAKVDNSAFRTLKAFTPGPYTFILMATSEVPRRLLNPRRRAIGLRVPDHPVTAALLEGLGEPIMSATLILPGERAPMFDPVEIRDRLESQVDLIIDAGSCGTEPSSVIDLTGDAPVVVRRGRGPVSAFE